VVSEGGEPSRVQKSFGTLVIILCLNLRCTFISAYNVHCNIYILATVIIYFLLDSGGGKGKHLPPAHNRRILNLEVVTLCKTSDS
jgi:hypothetical protein